MKRNVKNFIHETNLFGVGCGRRVRRGRFVVVIVVVMVVVVMLRGAAGARGGALSAGLLPRAAVRREPGHQAGGERRGRGGPRRVVRRLGAAV